MQSRLKVLDFNVYGLYFLVIIAIALYVSRKPKDHDRNAESCFLAGRSLPRWIIGAFLIASIISAEQIIEMNGTALESGIAIIFWILVCVFVNTTSVLCLGAITLEAVVGIPLL